MNYIEEELIKRLTHYEGSEIPAPPLVWWCRLFRDKYLEENKRHHTPWDRRSSWRWRAIRRKRR